MYDRNVQHYKEQSISTMTQGELLLLLYDELVKRLTQAELMLDKEMFPEFESTIQRSIDIVEYLNNTLDMQYPISRDLARLYEYFTYELGRAKIGRHKDPLTHVKEEATELRDAFRVAQKSADSEK